MAAVRQPKSPRSLLYPLLAVCWWSSVEGVRGGTRRDSEKMRLPAKLHPPVLHRLPTPSLCPHLLAGVRSPPRATHLPPLYDVTSLVRRHRSRRHGYTPTPTPPKELPPSLFSFSLSWWRHRRRSSSTVLRSKEDFNVRRHGSFATLANSVEARWNVDNGESFIFR